LRSFAGHNDEFISAARKLTVCFTKQMSNVLDEVEGLEPFPDMVSVMAQSQTPVLLGLDIGTSGVRAGLFDERGHEIEGASVRVDRSSHLSPNFATLDAEILLEQVAQTVDELFAKLNGSITRIELIAISCFWHSLVGVDESGFATTPVLGWADSRAVAATHELRSELDEAKFHALTGCRFHPSYWPAKLRRLRNEEPEIFRKTKRWLSFADFLTLRFFGESVVSVSMASGTGLMNQHTCEWDIELLEALGVRLESLPEIATPHREPPKLKSACAVLWPQLSEARLSLAVGDGAANNIGAGCNSIDKVALMIGTSGAMRVCFEGKPPPGVPPELWCYRADRKRSVVGGALSDGGGL
jgi:gluconokinase